MSDDQFGEIEPGDGDEDMRREPGDVEVLASAVSQLLGELMNSCRRTVARYG